MARDIAEVLIFLACAWILLCLFPAIVSGWIFLARRFKAPCDLGRLQTNRRWSSVNIGLLFLPVRFTWSMHVSIFEEGVVLRPVRWISLFMPALYFPWDAFSEMKERQFPFFCAVCSLNDAWPRITFFGDNARDSIDLWRRAANSNQLGIGEFGRSTEIK